MRTAVPGLLAAALLVQGCASHPARPARPHTTAADVLLPEHPAPMAPGPEVPAAIAPLAGTWEGAYDHGEPVVLVVYRLGPARARVLWAHGAPQDREDPPWHGFYSAEVSASPAPSLSWREGPVTFRWMLDRPDQLRFEATGGPVPGGATLRRRARPLVAHAPDVPGPRCPSVRAALAAIEATPAEARGPLVDAFVARARAAGGPLVEPGERADVSCVTFVFRGAAAEVVLSGDMNGWSRDRDRLDRVADTDLFVRSTELPADARLDYKLRTDGRWTLDPLNPREQLGGFGPNSMLPLPGWKAPPELTRRPETRRGTVEGLPLVSKHLGNRRKARVYLPAGYADSAARYPVVYLNDGDDELAYGAFDVILDELVARGALPPVVAVLVPPIQRGPEYARNPAFERFFLEEVVAAVDARYRTVAAPSGRIVGGASWGALAALSLGLGHPDVFGGVLLHSGAYGEFLAPLSALARDLGPRAPAAWIDVGTFEADMNGHDLLAENRTLRDALTAAGVRLRYLEVPEGHSWGSWRARKGEALGFLLGELGRR
ncbi:MAG: alpha/beta hydrolase-fold protein [Anaeromyxobacter sp.]